MITWDLELTMMHQVTGALQWHIAQMVQGSYFSLSLGLAGWCVCNLHPPTYVCYT